jgi:hypothetical protein
MQKTLTHYYLSRWCCSLHGYFESRTFDSQDQIKCPECGRICYCISSCEGYTVLAMPFVSKPRMIAAQEDSNFQVSKTKGITTRYATMATSRRRAGLKATGRKKKLKD